MRFLQHALALVCCFALALSAPFAAVAEEQPVATQAQEQADTTLTQEQVSAAVADGVEVEGLADETDDTADEADAAGTVASIQGLEPLYTTRIKPFTANGATLRMRAQQSTKSEVTGVLNKNDVITVYAVYPSYVLAECNGSVGYVIRTWVDEDMTPIDPVNTPPYGVQTMQFVATAIVPAKVYALPTVASQTMPIVVGAGSKVSILEFVDGFAKVIYWRSYGYIDARLLTDLITVSPANAPLSEDTPIAAFCSFFAYNTGAEGNDGRCKNIVRTCELMSRVLQPGESLDFNGQIGPYKKSNGYFPAPVLVNGGSQIGSGGGTCQSSSTMYNTIRQLPGITILMRRPHGPGCARYLPMHQDAAVGNAQLNLIFRNDYDYPLRFLAESTGEGTLCIQIFRAD
ncbi:MAG: VanW family protein [Clostridia bacterium]